MMLVKFTEVVEFLMASIISWLNTENQEHWALDLRQLPTCFGWFVSGLFFLGVMIELKNMHSWRAPFLCICSCFIGLIPWIWWMRQPVMTVAMRHAPFAKFEMDHAALVWDEKDELAICQKLENQRQEPHEVLIILPRTYWSNHHGNWLIRSSDTQTIGIIKNRPFSMSQMGDSSVSLAFGADSGLATAWGDPVHFRRYVFNSDEADW
jgi:hypothetical protein